jgi:hypothetical protein
VEADVGVGVQGQAVQPFPVVILLQPSLDDPQGFPELSLLEQEMGGHVGDLQKAVLVSLPPL